MSKVKELAFNCSTDCPFNDNYLPFLRETLIYLLLGSKEKKTVAQKKIEKAQSSFLELLNYCRVESKCVKCISKSQVKCLKLGAYEAFFYMLIEVQKIIEKFEEGDCHAKGSKVA